jgi:D-glycero-D-manno-heptose 1,7-bisphosphate phosphatase
VFNFAKNKGKTAFQGVWNRVVFRKNERIIENFNVNGVFAGPRVFGGMKRAIFFDRDGTLIEDRDYLSRLEEVVIFPGVPEALRRLQDAGFLLFLVTNQSGVGRGYFTMEAVQKVHAHLEKEFAATGVKFTAIYVAPEAPDQPARGRKPSPLFLFQARDEFGVDLGQSYIVGDKLSDLECGSNAGTRCSILVRTGYGAKLEKEDKSRERLKAAVVVDNLSAAADWILKWPSPGKES